MANGYALKQFVAQVARQLYGQEINTSPWSPGSCLRWFAGASRHYQWRDRISGSDGWYHDGNDRQRMMASVAVMLASNGWVTNASSKMDEDGMQDDSIATTDLVTSATGWSVWSGQHAVPLAQDAWHRITLTHLGWALEQVAKGNLPGAAIDKIIDLMVTPDPKDRKLPLFNPPPQLGPSQPGPGGQDMNDRRVAWELWRKESGGNRAMRIYGQASLSRWTEMSRDFERLDHILGGAERVLRYASLQEPLYRLQEKLEAMERKRAAFHNVMRVVNENPEAARRAFTPAELQHINAVARQVNQAELEAADKLPSEAWGDNPPQQLSGLGAPHWLLVVGVTGTVAIGLLFVVEKLIAALNDAANDFTRRSILQRQQNAVAAMQREAQEQAEARRLAAEQIQDPAQRAAALAQVSSWWTGMTSRFAQMKAEIAEAGEQLDESKKDDDEGKENSGLILLGIGALAAGYAFLKK